ncbi:hypothetical protein [Micromonospora sp. NPDC005652]|uniref:hypothetical protein n=1 Tax=Micromonospora sp. NPDC005652 TaxID=3157046 RepID=UPI00340A08AA
MEFRVSGHMVVNQHKVIAPINEGDSTGDGRDAARAAIREVAHSVVVLAKQAVGKHPDCSGYEASLTVRLGAVEKFFAVTGTAQGDSRRAAEEAMTAVKNQACDWTFSVEQPA